MRRAIAPSAGRWPTSMTLSRFSFPTTIHFGPGSRKLVAEHLRVQGVERPLSSPTAASQRLPLLGGIQSPA